jgi:hypothetical protein
MRISADTLVERGPNSFATTRDLAPKQVEANLRSHGCPEHLIKRVVESRSGKMGYTRKQPVGGSNLNLETSAQHWHGDVAQMLALLEKTARALGRPLTHSEAQALLRSCPNCAGGGDDVAAIRGHMEMCASLLDCALATAGTAQDIMDGDGWDDDKEEDSLRKRNTSSTYQSNRKKLREMHREFHRMLGECCGSHARTRLSASEILD